jgi:hypothetical protein
MTPATGIPRTEHTLRSPAGVEETLDLSRRLYEPVRLERMLRRSGFATTTR